MGVVRRSGEGSGGRLNARERYLRDLEARLPFALGLRARVIAEVREHLRDGGDHAVERFGQVEELAAELSRELRLRAVARASWLVPIVLVLFVFPLYVVPENTLPPAPWTDKPAYLAWKQHVAGAAFLVALAFAGSGLVVARVRPKLALVPLVCTVASLCVAVTFNSIVAVQWIEAVPGTSTAIMFATIAMSVVLALTAGLVIASALLQRRSELAAD